MGYKSRLDALDDLARAQQRKWKIKIKEVVTKAKVSWRDVLDKTSETSEQLRERLRAKANKEEWNHYNRQAQWPNTRWHD